VQALAGDRGKRGVMGLVTQHSEANLQTSKSISQRLEQGCFKKLTPEKQQFRSSAM